MSRKGWALFALVGVLWGIPYLFMKVAIDELSTAMIVFARLVIGALFLLPLAIKSLTFSAIRKFWPYIALYAILEMVIPWSLITSAQRDLSSGVVALLVATVPIWATLFAHRTGDTTAAERSRLFGIGIGLVGIVLIVGIESWGDFKNFQALSQVLIASASYAWAVNMVSRRVSGVSGVTINAIAMVMAALVFAPFALQSLPSSMPSQPVLLATFGLGLLCTGVAFWLFFLVLDEIGSARSSLVVYPNTAVAVLLGILVLSEPITIAIAIGLPLVLIGSYLAGRRSTTQPTAA